MDKIKKKYYDFQVQVKENPTKHILTLYLLLIISIIF